ncbi:MAG: metallophosphoesterase [Betaproteobacteria bacterium]|nr:metallophosphoesterase [Betaproteobacteria bacterium]MDE2623443.1 metallophosphoesterase [Betaproteobacteria bacterium]
MPKIALLSDIHSNLEALEACLAHATRQGADTFAFLGDLVGYGPDPAATLERIMDFASAGAPVVLGNHDRAVWDDAVRLNPVARQAILWTRPRLTAAQLAFLQSLPLTHHLENLLLVHASAEQPEAWTYLTRETEAAASLAATEATWTFAGHVHHQLLFYQASDLRTHAFSPTPGVAIPLSERRRWVATVGSVGQPRDRNTAAAYALFDAEARAVTFHRVPYDWGRTIYKIYSQGLPPALAHRLSEGR